MLRARSSAAVPWRPPLPPRALILAWPTLVGPSPDRSAIAWRMPCVATLPSSSTTWPSLRCSGESTRARRAGPAILPSWT
eukprot:8530002-Alexandrium_andersonii.AAC.1